MKCNITGCVGEYEIQNITHTVQPKGKVMVIDHVPAEVCSHCGDVLLRPETLRHIEKLISSLASPARSVPLYEYV